jgi:hypothetical protein
MIVDVITEAILVLLPVLFVWRIHFDVRQKIQVAAAFAFRLP